MQIVSNVKSKVNFKAGLTPNIKKSVSQVKIGDVESAFWRDYGVDAKFGNSKFYAFGFALVLNVFEELTEKFSLPFGALPPKIRVYNKEQLFHSLVPDNFCIPKSGLVLKEQPPFKKRSIFMRNRDDVVVIDKKISQSYERKERSSGHFMSNIIHEWWHNVHLASKKDITDDKLIPSGDLKNDIKKNLGTYALNSCSKMEIFAELMTKLLTDSLDEESLRVKNNPLDNLKQFSPNLVKFVEEELKNF